MEVTAEHEDIRQISCDGLKANVVVFLDRGIQRDDDVTALRAVKHEADPARNSEPKGVVKKRIGCDIASSYIFLIPDQRNCAFTCKDDARINFDIGHVLVTSQALCATAG